MPKGAYQLGIERSTNAPCRTTRRQRESKTTTRALWKSVAYSRPPASVSPRKTVPDAPVSTAITAWVDQAFGIVGVQALIIPSSHAYRNRAGAAWPPPCTRKPPPALKATPVGPPGTATVRACLWPSPAYKVLELRPSLATHHGPSALAASLQALMSRASARSVTSSCREKRSVRALLAEPAAA